jgi:predicted  nucleic acid-binding Zn-ribbon protein
MVRQMGIHADAPEGLASLSNRTLRSMLDGLEEEERVLSRRRRLLHDRIDELQGRQGDRPGHDPDTLGSLQYNESRLSERRLHLHQRIAELRIEIGQRRRSLAGPSLTLVE